VKNERSSTGVPRLQHAGEVAERLNVTRDRVYELARRRLIPSVRLGRQLRFDGAAIEQWINSGGRPLSAAGEPHDARA
jgi:excisionase family DNA binding protein